MYQGTNITVNISGPNVPSLIYAKQNDAATRYVDVTLLDGAAEYIIPAETTAVFRAKKPDGTGVFYDAVIAENVVQCELKEQVLAAAGLVEAEVNLYNAVEDRLTSFKFNISVEASVITDAAIVSSNYFNALTQIAALILATNTAVKPLAFFETYELLNTTITGPSSGDMYGVGTVPPYVYYTWDGVHSAWINNGEIGASGVPYLGTSTGTSSALVLDYTGVIGNGEIFVFMPNANAAAGATLQIGSGSALPLLNHDGTAVDAGMLYANVPITAMYRAAATGITAAYVVTLDGANGATFTPSVSTEGVISWTNDKGLANPTPRSIMGPIGLTGATGATGPANTLSIGTVEGGAVADASISGTAPNQSLNLVLPKGDPSTVPGPTGNGIASITLLSGNHAPGTTDTYRITFTDASTVDFGIYNGADGAGTGDMLASVYADSAGVVKDSTKLGGQLPSYYLAAAQKGAVSGVAELDEYGHVPSSQLPSYVDDVIDAYIVDGATAFSSGWLSDTSGGTALTPEDGKVYVVLTAGDYQNKTYRWSGSVYVVIGNDLALGETSSTAHRGDHGKSAYDHSQIATGNPHGTTRSDIGAAASGANSDITSLSGLTTALSVAQGGTGAATAAGALANLGAVSPTTPVTVVAVTESKTFALTDINTFQACSHASTAIVLTVPKNTTVDIPIGSCIAVSMDGAAQVSFLAAADVTINPSTTLKISEQYKTAALIKTATNTWVLSGSLKA